MSLFETGSFTLHSGDWSDFHINCEHLSSLEVEVLAWELAQRLQPFDTVIPIPEGGNRIGESLLDYRTPGAKTVLLVDDVLTTGNSMKVLRADLAQVPKRIIGGVIFARGPCPNWITPLFQMTQVLEEPATPRRNASSAA